MFKIPKNSNFSEGNIFESLYYKVLGCNVFYYKCNAILLLQ
jgi:hypothetical protein